MKSWIDQDVDKVIQESSTHHLNLKGNLHHFYEERVLGWFKKRKIWLALMKAWNDPCMEHYYIIMLNSTKVKKRTKSHWWKHTPDLNHSFSRIRWKQNKRMKRSFFYHWLRTIKDLSWGEFDKCSKMTKSLLWKSSISRVF